MHGHMPESEVLAEADDLSEAAFVFYNVDSRPIVVSSQVCLIRFR